MTDTPIEYSSGWYGEEHAEGRSFRWMAERAALRLAPGDGGPTVLRLLAGHAHPQAAEIDLRVTCAGAVLGERHLVRADREYCFPLPRGASSEIVLEVSPAYEVAGDTRRLGLRLAAAEIVPPEQASPWAAGFHEPESGEYWPFRWMGRRAALLDLHPRDGAGRYLSVYLHGGFANFSQTLTLDTGAESLTIPLLSGWQQYHFPLPAARRGDGLVTLAVNKLLPAGKHRGDDRELGLKVGPLAFHDDAAAVERQRRFLDNARLNFTEMMEGRTELRSFPPLLGIDLFGRCNIHPPCVYCLWDHAKISEGRFTPATVDRDTLAGYGDFFTHARHIVNCSFGEPTLHPQLPEILEFLEESGKWLELSTNGQLLTERITAAMAGKRITLYVSLDAAGAETYARLRNERWEEVAAGLRRLGEARSRGNGLPRLYLVFMPMPANLGDLENFFRLCRDVRADALVLRPLCVTESKKEPVERAGYRFVYRQEILPHHKLDHVWRECRRFSRQYNVTVINQFEFGPTDFTGPEPSTEVQP